MPEGLKSAFGLNSGSNDESEEPDVHKKSLHALYRIILGVAVSKYGFQFGLDKDEKQPGVYAAMATNLMNAGVSLSEPTIRTHLRAAREWAIAANQEIAKRNRPKATK